MRAIVLESLLDRTCAQEKPDKSLAILLRYVVSSFLNHRYLHNSPHGMLSVKLDCQKLRVLVSKLTQQANSSHGEPRLIQNSTNWFGFTAAIPTQWSIDAARWVAINGTGELKGLSLWHKTHWLAFNGYWKTIRASRNQLYIFVVNVSYILVGITSTKIGIRSTK
jgi:hypothetical protein